MRSLAGELERLGELGGVFVALPEDAAAALGADDRVPGEFHHRDAVGHADAQRAAGAAFAGDDADDRRLQAAHLHQVAGDRLGLPALFGADAGVGAGRVDQGDDRQAELLGQLHAAQGFAIALGVGQAEVALDLFLGVPALVVADEHDLVPGHAGQAALDGGVVAEVAVAVQFAELAADHVDVVVEQRPLRVAGDLDGLPGGQVVVGLAQQRGVVGAKLAKLFGVIDLLGGLQGFELVDLLFELGQRLFEFEHVPGGRLGGAGAKGRLRRGSTAVEVARICHVRFRCRAGG